MQVSLNLPESQLEWLKKQQAAETLPTSLSRVVQKAIQVVIDSENE